MPSAMELVREVRERMQDWYEDVWTRDEVTTYAKRLDVALAEMERDRELIAAARASLPTGQEDEGFSGEQRMAGFLAQHQMFRAGLKMSDDGVALYLAQLLCNREKAAIASYEDRKRREGMKHAE